MRQQKAPAHITPKAPITCRACNAALTSKFAAKHHACRASQAAKPQEGGTNAR